MVYTPIESFENIDISKHGLIEASAGTGKTYTIENLVVKFLLKRQDLNLENILLVTFTEKATCELKFRIREKLENLLHDISDPSDIAKIKRTLDSFDTASIYTFHGFCQTILNDYAFENQTPFQWEVIDDSKLLETLLKEQIRKTWPAKFGHRLLDVLVISGFTRQKSKFESSVINAARSFRQGTKDRIKPDISQLALSDITTVTDKIRNLVLDLKNLSASARFCYGFQQLNIHKVKKKFLSEKIITPLENFLTETEDSERFSMQPLLDIIITIDNKGVDYLQIKYLKKGPVNSDACPHWEIVCQVLKKIHRLWISIRDALKALAIVQLQEDATLEKLKNGWISFDDMLLHVKKAVCSPRGSSLVTILRKKFMVAFVDEFQDTDPVQWMIFKNIFLLPHKDAHHNLLFLIGDPKQAIYGFRGADVYAYLEARHEMENLAQKGLACCYSLSTNWRSEPQLINVFNKLFNTPDWFGSSEKDNGFQISYFPAHAPDQNKRILSFTRDYSDRGFLNIIDISNSPSPKASKPVLARFIAEEIKYLTAGQPKIFYKQRHEKENPLSFGDICILVRSKFDMPFLEEPLNSLNIPYSYYKKPGLFSSSEAFYLSLVFHSILEPSNLSHFHKALLTPFFDFKPEELHLTEELSPDHPVKRLLFQWHNWSISRKWSRLFQSLMEDSGLIFRQSAKPDWERTYTNYRQILEHLHETAYLQNLDFRAITSLLDGYRKGTSAAGQDADLHQIETEELKVQIMTMHVAKGLEFPVVFVFGGLTRPSGSKNDYYVYHEISGNSPGFSKVFDLCKTSEGKKEHDAEIQSEDKRLFYVALTRARLKLYVPYYDFTKNYAWVGPVCNLLSPALKKAFSASVQNNHGIYWFNGTSLEACKHGSEPLPQKPLSGFETMNSQEPTPPVPSPLFLQPGQFSHRIIQVASFSSLHHMASEKKLSDNIPAVFSAFLEPPKEDDELFETVSKEILEETQVSNDIPGGTETGSMFHDILENISFRSVLEAASNATEKIHPLIAIPQTRKLIETTMDFYQIDRQWTHPICDVILKTLTTPVFKHDPSFVLAQLTGEDRVHEAEFYFSYPLTTHQSLPDLDIFDGYIRGFIDLIFRHNNQFYIADWKSNILENGYSRSSMEKSMDEANYHLQYKIYTVATLRWLKNKMGPHFDPNKNFGGIFYFYLRGMDGKTDNGIYHVSPATIGSIDKLENSLIDD